MYYTLLPRWVINLCNPAKHCNTGYLSVESVTMYKSVWLCTGKGWFADVRVVSECDALKTDRMRVAGRWGEDEVGEGWEGSTLHMGRVHQMIRQSILSNSREKLARMVYLSGTLFMSQNIYLNDIYWCRKVLPKVWHTRILAFSWCRI